MAASTQEHLLIKDIAQDIVFLKDGSMCIVIQTSAVNFGLLSENEQLAIISSFAGMLNSLSFMIQVLIRSKRLDISSYLAQLDEARQKQANPLLSEMIGRYRNFIETTIQENEVLDKQFYVVIPVSYLELGLIKGSAASSLQKALSILLPRRDHIARQLARIGLKAIQLNTEELVRLFYDIYNEQNQLGAGQVIPAAGQAQINQVQAVLPAQQGAMQGAVVMTPMPTEVRTATPPPPVVNPTPAAIQPAPVRMQPSARAPFIVEELPDEFGTVS